MPASHPTVSIIVAIYNVEDYLEQCIESIVSQSFTDIEILLVDDGSTDRSLEICSRYEAQDERIIVIHQENAGVSAARNKGLSSATGDWIMFVDGDDWLTPDAVETLFQSAVLEEDCDIVVGLYYKIFTVPKQQEWYIGDTSLIGRTYIFHPETCLRDLIRYVLSYTGMPELSHINCNLQAPWAKLYRHSMLKSNKLLFIPDLDRWEDQIFNLYAFYDARKVVVVNAPVCHYRFRSGSVMHQNTGIEAITESVDIWMRKVKKFLENFPENTDDIYNEFLFFVLKSVTDFYFNAYLFGSLSRGEAVKNMRQLFNRETYRKIIQSISENIRNDYFSTRNRFTFSLFRSRNFNLYLTLRHVNFRIDAKRYAQ